MAIKKTRCNQSWILALLVLLVLVGERNVVKAWTTSRNCNVFRQRPWRCDDRPLREPTIRRWASLVSSSSSAVDEILEQKKSTTTTALLNDDSNKKDDDRPSMVLVAGFESFNRQLYLDAASQVPGLALKVFADTEIRTNDGKRPNPVFVNAVRNADLFMGSLIFDYDDVQVVRQILKETDDLHSDGASVVPPRPKSQQPQPRLIFESATELMEFNRIGTFTMMPPKRNNEEQEDEDGNSPSPSPPPGPPPAVKAILKRFSSGKEEDKLSGYLELLKFGPDLLQFVPGEKASDLRTWLEAYRYWNQSGLVNARSMLLLLQQRLINTKSTITATTQITTTTSSSSSSTTTDTKSNNKNKIPARNEPLPKVVVTPGVGLVHPHRPNYYWTSPKEYLQWRLQEEQPGSNLLQAPRVAVLLYRKHVISELRYINDMVLQLEAQNLLPIPIFINGVEAHTIVRDLLTSTHKEEQVTKGTIQRESTFQANKAVAVDAIVNTVGFPLVGGPAGSMEAGRNVDVAQALLSEMNVPYMVASPLLLQSIRQWQETGVLGLQSVVLYSLPELDGAIDTVVLGGLVGDKIALVPERVRKLAARLDGWISLRRTPPNDRKISVCLYGFPPNVGAVGTAALLDVPRSLENLLKRLSTEGYDVGDWATDHHACGESLVAALAVLSEDPVITAGADRMVDALERRMERARSGDPTTAECLSREGGGLGGAKVQAWDVSLIELEEMLGKYMFKKVQRAWSERDASPGLSAAGRSVVSGLQLGNVFITVQPLLGVEGDPMRLLFERDLTPHPQYCAAYSYIKQNSDAVIHLGMHGTVEWLPGQSLGNDRKSWSDELLGQLPNVYLYAMNNPSESILAKRRGYGTLVSYCVPPLSRSGLYMDLANLKELVDECRSVVGEKEDLIVTVVSSAQRCGMLSDVPILLEDGTVVDAEKIEAEGTEIPSEIFNDWIFRLNLYLDELQNRLFSSGLRTFGAVPDNREIESYLLAFYGDNLSDEELELAMQEYRKDIEANENKSASTDWFSSLVQWFQGLDQSTNVKDVHHGSNPKVSEAANVATLLHRSTEELDAVMNLLGGGYVKPNPGGDLIRDGSSVLPTGRNIHSLDPFRMPSAGAWIRGQKAAKEILRQHQAVNDGRYPETVAVTLWGLDAIKTRGESVAIVLSLVGAKPVKEGTGRVVRFDLIPLEELDRPRIDILASMSGIFRDSFANIVDLLDDMFGRAATADDEPIEMNFIKKHASALQSEGVERPAARLFSNPPGDYGSMVNELVGNGDWEDSESLGETWRSRNVFSYGRDEGVQAGTARPQVLDKLLETTERVVQEIDSVEYGLTDIQEYYANTGALKKSCENRKPIDPTSGKRKKVDISVIEAFYSGNEDEKVPVKNVEDVLRLEYRSKLLNPKWRDAMMAQGSGGAFEVSQRMTAMVGWGAVAEVDNFVFDQAAERYALDQDVARQLQRNNPEAFKNVVRRLLEAAGRGMWETDDETLYKLQELYAEADDLVEQVGAPPS